MRALFDTHALLHWVDVKARLSREQRRTIDRAAKQGDLWVSEISFWEVASLVDIRDSKLVAVV